MVLGLDDESEDPVMEAEAALSKSMNNLQEIGVLPQGNRLDIEPLMNMAEEQVMIEEVSDEAICEAVQQKRRGEEGREINGGDDEGDTVVPKPTRKVALEAASTLIRFNSELCDPFARKLEALLSAFGRETRRKATKHLVDTSITDYLVQK
ncbi:hypothetical protein B0H13DRAFT_742706 [Mycena leptocephala]|nr:hypothetical protein B0H13DRAFT_742706 [Mycena leptocephala]